jgi:hypothetical protein
LWKGEGGDILMKEDPPDFDRLGLNRSWDEFYALDPAETAKKAGVEFDEDAGEIYVPFYEDRCKIKFPERVVRYRESDRELNPFFTVIIIHYLVGAQEVPRSDKLISFRELYGGGVYYQAFYNRAVKTLAATFSEEPELLLKAADKLDPKKIEKGDCAIEVAVLPKVPLTVIIWKGDEEVQGSANVLFDSTANKHLPTEDLAAVSELLAKKLVGNIK